jgi:hypothetical protein
MTQAAKQDLRNLKDFVNLIPERVISNAVKESVFNAHFSRHSDSFTAFRMTKTPRYYLLVTTLLLLKTP